VDTSEPIATGQVAIKAPAAEVYRLVSDPTVMVGFAEEVYRARWLGDAGETTVGRRFRGYNRNGARRWWTVCRVTDAEPGRCFAYEVRTPFMVPIARWQFDLQPSADGCTVVESSWLRVPRWFIPIAILITGQPDRPGTNKSNIAITLSRLKQHAETLTALSAPEPDAEPELRSRAA
jgi:polyketide cyclase/dehydrase/lipid transport protein